VRNFKFLCGLVVVGIFGALVSPASASDAKREVVVLNLIDNIRKGISLQVPTFTLKIGSETPVPSNSAAARAALRNCKDNDPFIADILEADAGSQATAIVLKCKKSKQYAVIFMFSASGVLEKATFFPGGIAFAPPPLPDFDPAKAEPR
jgi:hypothetical protein